MKSLSMLTPEYSIADRPQPATLSGSNTVAVQNIPTAGIALELSKLVVPLPNGPLRVDGLHIASGEKVAVIGRNGVGKTSLTEAVLGFRSGAIVEGRMLGADIAQWRRKPALRKRLGAQLQRVAYPGRPRVREIIAMHRALFDHTSNDVIEALGVMALSNQLYEFLSRGETQRVDLFLALAHEPEILFLDEPFTGLDPHYAKMLAGLIRGLRNTTIVMCCHTADELSLATQVAWVVPGGIARYASPDVLRGDLVGEYRLTAKCDADGVARSIADIVPGRHPHSRTTVTDGGRITVASPEPLAELARALVDWPGVRAVEVGRSSLTDLLRICAQGN